MERIMIMSRQIVKTIYQYDELNESAKERALGWPEGKE